MSALGLCVVDVLHERGACIFHEGSIWWRGIDGARSEGDWTYMSADLAERMTVTFAADPEAYSQVLAAQINAALADLKHYHETDAA